MRTTTQAVAMTTEHLTSDMPQRRESTPHKLTRESLIKSRKLDLQNHCRDLGISNVWARKDELISKILEAYKSTPAPNVVHSAPHSLAADQQPPASPGTPPYPPAADQQLPSPRADKQAQPPPPVVQQPSLIGADQLPLSLNTRQPKSQSDSNHNALLTPNNHENTQHQPGVEVSSTPDGLVLDPTQEQTPTAPDKQQSALLSQDATGLLHPPPGATGSTTPRISVTDKETHNEIEKMKKCIEVIMSKLEIKDLEMELLSTEVKSAYSTIEMLQKRVIELETRNIHEKTSTGSPFTTNCLLLGDTNLQQVLPSDLGKNCSVRTITMGSIDKIRNFVTHKLSRIPSACVLNCGLYDLCDNVDSDTILDNLGSLVSDLQDKCSNMKIYVCDIVPAQGMQEVNDKIVQYNDKLAKWADANGVRVVNTSAMFTLSTGDVDEMCFSNVCDTTVSIFNRFGAIRLGCH